MKKNTNEISDVMKMDANRQLIELQKQIDYDTRDYTVEHIINKFDKKDFFIPDYQRKYIWQENNKSLFIESLLIGIPIPFMFFAASEDEKYEIIDGAQRIQTLVAFHKNEFPLRGLKKLSLLNGFRFHDLLEVQQRKFENKGLRIIIIESGTSKKVRQDIFNRINTSGLKATDAEIRRGSYPGALTEFIDACVGNAEFIKLCPVSEKQKKRHERFELLLRFFAYLNCYTEFDHSVKNFLDSFLIQNQDSFDKAAYQQDFQNMLGFVKKYFQYGFAKTKKATTTPRVRFEAISVGVALALRLKPDLAVTDINWLASKEFDELTTSDASNNQGKLKKRVEFVRDHLLKGDESNG